MFLNFEYSRGLFLEVISPGHGAHGHIRDVDTETRAGVGLAEIKVEDGVDPRDGEDDDG